MLGLFGGVCEYIGLLGGRDAVAAGHGRSSPRGRDTLRDFGAG